MWAHRLVYNLERIVDDTRPESEFLFPVHRSWFDLCERMKCSGSRMVPSLWASHPWTACRSGM